MDRKKSGKFNNSFPRWSRPEQSTILNWILWPIWQPQKRPHTTLSSSSVQLVGYHLSSLKSFFIRQGLSRNLNTCLCLSTIFWSNTWNSSSQVIIALGVAFLSCQSSEFSSLQYFLRHFFQETKVFYLKLNCCKTTLDQFIRFESVKHSRISS